MLKIKITNIIQTLETKKLPTHFALAGFIFTALSLIFITSSSVSLL